MAFQWSDDDLSIGDGFIRIAREQIDRATAIAEDGTQPPAKRVHEARRRGKKLRALLRLVRPDFNAYAQENAFVRDAARGLSAARDMKVARDTLATLMEWTGRPITAPPAPELPSAGEPELAVFAGLMREMSARTTRWKTGKIDIETLAGGLTNTYRKGLDAMTLVAAHPSDTGFHEWRKHVKYHWNQIGLIEACAVNILPSAHQAVGQLAEVLGLHHDLAMLRDKITGTPDLLGDIDPGFVHDAILRRQRELEAEIAALGRQVFAETPKALHARFLSYLDGWVTQEAAE
jgi:hypothetical protein